MVIPLVIYGMKALATLQVWTTPLWLILMVLPMIYLVATQPESIDAFVNYAGESGSEGVALSSVMLAAGVCLSLIVQIAEQIDYLRFMPPRTEANKKVWWASVICAGPGWVVLGALKQITGLFIAVYLIATLLPEEIKLASEPVHQFLGVYEQMMPGWLAMTLAVILVVISQIKINVTNAYSGSLAWTNSFTRVTKHYPGRMVFVIFNLAIALLLMEMNMFDFLNNILGFYANCGIAWIVTVATDIAINKYVLKLSPKVPEFRRGMIYAFNPVGFVSLTLSAGLSIATFFGLLGSWLQPYSPLVALVVAFVMTPVMAIVTQGKYYQRRAHDGIDIPMFDEFGNPSGVMMTCVECETDYERPDMLATAAAPKASICSLCASTDSSGKHILPVLK